MVGGALCQAFVFSFSRQPMMHAKTFMEPQIGLAQEFNKTRSGFVSDHQSLLTGERDDYGKSRGWNSLMAHQPESPFPLLGDPSHVHSISIALRISLL